MPLRYRLRGDRLLLRLDADTDTESRFWRTLARMGAPLEEEKDALRLAVQRSVLVANAPRLRKAAALVGVALLPEAGEGPLPEPQVPPYATSRPVDPDQALSDAGAGVIGPGDVREAVRALRRFAEATPAHRDAALADANRLEAALARFERPAAGSREADPLARETSEAVRGIPGDDALRAYRLLLELARKVEAMRREAPPPPPLAAVPDLAGFRGVLRHYQEDGVRFLIATGLNAVLADEMGLGKTIEAIAVVLAARERALVVCPANVLYNWAAEVERFTGEAALVHHEGRTWGPEDARFLVTTYDALARFPWGDPRVQGRDVLVLDEAHFIRNPDTQRSLHVRALPQKRRVLLTGTPLVNGVEDVYELLRHVGGTPFASASEFRELFVADRALFERYGPVRRRTVDLLLRLAQDKVLRRRKADVLPDLPPRTIQVNRHELAAAEAAAYEALALRARERLAAARTDVEVFAQLHALRSFVANARVPVVAERVREILDDGRSVVVYAHYLEPLRGLLRLLGPQARMLSGETPPRERLELARGLGTDGGYRVLLAQMETGGVGLNLTGASHVLFLHLAWTAAAHAQAMDRVHRIGQDEPVLVEFWLSPATFDERLAGIVLRKEADANLVLNEESDTMNRSALLKALLPPPEKP